MAIYGSLGEVNVGALSATTADNAVDVFVYDTRKDSDGGQWRKRTQHTSWYNETLNTATRGSRRDFPAVAILVLESNGIFTIYDGDDPDMSMWMKFTGTGTSNWNQGVLPVFNNAYTATSALNGIICVTTTLNSYGIIKINFISDNAYSHTTATNFGGLDTSPLSLRNTNLHTFLSNNGSLPALSVLSNNNLNDVSMTVLPNAPIDPATGLPVPTIAAATNGGVSVIRDDGTVSNLTYSSVATQTVTFDKNNGLWVCFGGGGSSIGWYYYTNFTTTSSLQLIYHNNSGWSGSYDMLDGVIYRGIAYSYSNISTGTNGLSNFTGFGALKASTTMSNFITTSYNTGWMHGDIKGAWLSDTSTASVTGTELNQYGDFSSTTGWESRSAAWTISGGVATVSSGAGYQLLGTSSGTLVNGRKYSITVNVTAFTNGRLELSQANSSNIPLTLSSTGFKSFIITYTGTTGYSLGFYGYGDVSYGFTIDNLFVRELLEADRSVNNNGLAVYGTITKSPVATGSNLVAYSGFSTSNYLQQPYNSALDFGTGNYSIILWINSPTILPDQSIFTLGDYNQSNSLSLLVLNSGGDGNTLQYSERGTSILLSIGPHENSGWTQIAIVRNGTTVFAYRNGILQSISSNTSPNNINFSSATYKNLVIGAGSHSGSVSLAYSGQISLFRISASAPSPEQIRKIYEDEKALFQPNSQCTLYGSSDAVTALAYDDTYQILSVGTSSGRSDFRGLERINNTTTAVTTAISASNGLIAEQ
jgi:hypothetical protein